jgi:hypothetical protein
VKLQLAFLPFFILLATTAGSGETFRNPVRIATGTDPNGIMVADLTGNKRMDILWTARGPLTTDPSTVHTLLAQADGSFAAGPVLTLPADVSVYCQVADETGDGKPDLVCPYADLFAASIMVFPGKGDGSFGSPIESPLPTSSSFDAYWGPVLGPPANFHGHGMTDFVIANVEAYSSYVLLGNGDGTFTVVTQNERDSLFQGANQYEAVDINGDGHIDLLFNNGAVLLGDGTGQFKAARGSMAWIAGYCAFGKLNGDPHIDAVCEGGSPAVNTLNIPQFAIYHGNGDGSFNVTPVRSFAFGGLGTLQFPLAVVDLTGDGIPDILAEAADGLTVLLGSQGLGFSYPANYATGYNPESLGVVGQFGLRIADLNGDGLPDLIQSGPNGVYITYGRPDGVYDTAQALELAQVIGYETVADFNEDGIPDIAATGDQAIELSLGKGDGTFEYRTALPRGDADFSTPLSATNAQIVHGDFNGDHHQDIIAIGSSSIYQYDDYILFGHGDGTFTTPALVANSSQTYPMYYRPQVFDFNSDCKDDLFTSDSNNLYVDLSNGDGSFRTVTTVTAASLQTHAAIADLTGDGKLDAVFGELANVEVFKGHGDGTFDTSGLSLPIPQFNGAAVQGSIAVAVGDFDGDGHQDIALLATPAYNAQGYGSALFVYYGKGDGAFSAGVPVTGFDRGYTNIYAADLNKDGLDDLVLRTSGSLGGGYAVGIVHCLPGRKFGPEINYYAGTGLADLAIVDLNGDGFPDLVFGNGDYNFGANSATVLMNLGNSSGVTGSLYALPEPSDTANSFQLVASLDAPDQAVLTGNVTFFVDGESAGSAVLADNQAGITVSKEYAAGLHSVKATWPGNTEYAAVTLTGEHQITAGYPTSTRIVTSYNPVPFLTSLTFKVAVQSTSGTPAGIVNLLDGTSHLIGVHLSGGQATVALASLTPGTHTITAEYVPATGWAASSATLQQVVDPVNVTATMTVNGSEVYALQTIDLTAIVKPPTAGPTPTGTVQFSLDFSPVGSSKLVNGAATFATSITTPGYHTFSAEYAGNLYYNPGYAEGPTLNVLVNPTVTSLQATPNPALAAQPVTLTASVTSSTATQALPSGGVEFIDNGGQIGSAQLAKGTASIKLSSLAVGTHSITVSYLGTSAFNRSQSNPISLVIQKAPSSIALSASPNPATVNTQVVFKAVVRGARQPTGSVIFREGSRALTAAIPVDFEGTATFSTTSLSAGTHTIVADYSGDPNLDVSTSAPLIATIDP